MAPSPASRPTRPSPLKDHDADYHDYVVRDLDTFFGMFSNRPEARLEPAGRPRNGAGRVKSLPLPRHLCPIPGLHAGAAVRLYGGSDEPFGWPIRGIDVGGREVFYRPLEDALEGWWRETSSRSGHDDEVLHRYTPPRWRTLLPGAPTEISLTRRHVRVKARGSSAEDTFPLYEHLWVHTEHSSLALSWALAVYAVLLAVVIFAPPQTVAFSVSLVVAWLLGHVLSRSRALRLSGRGQDPRRSYPLLGRDPDLAALVKNIELFHALSERCYWRERWDLPPA